MVQDVTQRAREDERRAFLAKASEVFAGSLDLRRTFDSIARLFVPKLADWAEVFVRRDDGSVELVTASHADPEAGSRIRALFEKAPAEVRNASPWAEALRAGRPTLVHDVASALHEDASTRALRPWLDLMHRELGAVSILSVPMAVRGGHAIGVLSVGSCRVTHRFHPEQIPVFEEVARRGASAIQNARLLLANRERRRADEANRAKDEFLAVLSHELRTPLNAVLGWTRMVASDAVPPERLREALQVIERNALAQAQLIEDLLDLSRIITGQLRLEPEPFEIAEVVRAAVESVTAAAAAKGVSLETTIDRAAGSMLGDPNRVRQAVWNLLTNAVKFTPRGGHVSIRCAREEDRMVVTVTDTGEGIAPEFVPHVFERFQQADMCSTRRHGGLGLGLALVRHIAELHGGTVDAASAGGGQGSTFRLELPIVRPRGPAAQANAPATGTRPRVGSPADLDFAAVQGFKLLVVDDDEDSRELLDTMLSYCGANVSTAASVKAAIAAFDEQRPDVLISDIAMPGEDGYDLIERLRTRPPREGGKVPAVALTAYARTEDRTKALLAGFNAHVAKPVDLEELVRVIAEVARATA